jgi:uncharacterized protein (DUF433 family)
MANTNDRITKTPGVCGGNACIRGTRIKVWRLVARRKLGLDDEEIKRRVQGLSLADVEAAWNYACEHTDEIEEVIRLNEGA